mmetsp:Transcript_92177/g.269726  ORF Transcript_92177/g.269726 Transcript_92177/m.269726 type:complete len:292 (+) Transcript_92177:72-947(+)
MHSPHQRSLHQRLPSPHLLPDGSRGLALRGTARNTVLEDPRCAGHLKGHLKGAFGLGCCLKCGNVVGACLLTAPAQLSQDPRGSPANQLGGVTERSAGGAGCQGIPEVAESVSGRAPQERRALRGQGRCKGQVDAIRSALSGVAGAGAEVRYGHGTGGGAAGARVLHKGHQCLSGSSVAGICRGAKSLRCSECRAALRGAQRVGQGSDPARQGSGDCCTAAGCGLLHSCSKPVLIPRGLQLRHCGGERRLCVGAVFPVIAQSPVYPAPAFEEIEAWSSRTLKARQRRHKAI